MRQNKIVVVLEDMVAKHFDRYGIEIKTDPLPEDGTQSRGLTDRTTKLEGNGFLWDILNK